MTESNAALAKQWFDEVWNRRSDTTVRALFHPEGVGHLEGMDIRGPDEFLAARNALLGTFSDLAVEVDATVSEEDDVVVRWSAKGTHDGGGLGIEATARSVSFGGMTWLRFANGRIVEGWDRWNVGGLLEQLRLPQPPAAKQSGRS